MATNPAVETTEQELVSRWLGKTIKDKYLVEKVIGSGGMAVVYAARHRNGKRFALKMLHRELSLNTFVRQRFLREGYVANRVEHPGAVAIIDDDVTDDGSAFLVMELLHGATIESVWEGHNHQLPLGSVLAIAEQLLDVLASAHAQNIVHRDLKPANMFLTREGSVKVLDFGIARLHEADASRTETGTTLGTPLFMPPEQASGRSRDVDARTDIWAVGATMFSLLSGQYVHDGENATQVLISAATSQARSLSTAVARAHPAIVALIDKALAFDSDDRWASAVDMRAAVMAAHETVFGAPVSRDMLKNLVRAAVISIGKGEISGVGPTAHQTPSEQPPERSGVPRTLPMNPKPRPITRPSHSSPQVATPAPAVSITNNDGRVSRSAAPLVVAVVAGLLAAVVCGAGAIWFVSSHAPANAPVVTASPNTTGPAVQTPAVTIAPPPPAAPTAVATLVAPEVQALPTTAPAPSPSSRLRPGVTKPGKGVPTAGAAPQEPPPVAPPLPPSPTPAAPPPEAPQNKANPPIDRSNPFN
jgi:serine/threonine-protein kinase